MKNSILINALFSKGSGLIISLILLLFLSNEVYSQEMGVRFHVPFSKFYGNGLSNTKYKPIINYNCINLQFYAPERSFTFFAESGFSAIGTKQDYNGQTLEAELFGIYLGLFLKYNILESKQTPYIYTGINLNLNFANELKLVQNIENNKVFTDLDHRIFLPLMAFGVGYALMDGVLCIDIRNNIGLSSVDPENTVNCNVISFGIIYKK